MYIGVKLLYKHDKTPQRSLKKIFLAPSPNDSRERNVRKVQQDNMTLWINTTFLKVLREVLTGLLITEPNVKKGKRTRRRGRRRRRRRRRRTRTSKRIPAWSRFALRCHSAVYPREREREREKTQSQLDIGMKGYVCMKYA